MRLFLAALLLSSAFANAQGAGDDTARAAAVRYRTELMDTAVQKFGRYPRAAMDAGLKGRAVIRLEFAASGRMRGISVHESSGHSILDEAALDTVVDAVGATKIPGALKGREFSVDVPVLFKIEAQK